MVPTSTFDLLSVVIVSVEGQTCLLIGFLLKAAADLSREKYRFEGAKIGDHPVN